LRSVILDEVGSTNAHAFALAEAGEAGPLWILAHRQTQGRGRSGRHWASEPGNFHASFLQKLPCPPRAVHQLSLLAGVAVVDAIQAAAVACEAPVRGLRLKWPNDVLIDAAKCAGILAESQLRGAGCEVTAVIGIGINLAWHPGDLGRPATHLAAHGIALSAEALLPLVAQAMSRWLARWALGSGFAEVRRAWIARAGAVGEPCSIDTGKERIMGTFLDLDDDGALIMRDQNGLQRRLTFGDVTLTPAAAEDQG
jgi:BirA family transcriptional regulator, biotin operon repressor / biotin---[acetyl-CoA-carboxylase] ligase